jgi:hypothetical protein
MSEKLSEWFDGILKKHLPRGITVVYIDTGDLPHLTSGIKELEIENERLTKINDDITFALSTYIEKNEVLKKELAKKSKPTRQELMNRRFTI